MCGRYTLFVSPEVLKQRFKSSIDEANLPKFQPRYNVAPTQDVPVITSAIPREISFARWGLIPSWAKDVAIGSKMINARAETLLEKPSFRSLVKNQRCLVIANGFYEWRQDTSPKQRKYSKRPKQPMYISLKSGEPFALAGLWDEWQNPATTTTAQLRTCTIITTEPNELIAPMHHRMAVMLQPHEEELWLDKQTPTSDLIQLLKPYPAEEMIVRPASFKVNDVHIDTPSLMDAELDNDEGNDSAAPELSLFG